MKASLILALVKSQVDGDSDTFRKVAMQIAAKEASTGHTKVANELRKLIDKLNVDSQKGQYVGRPGPITPIARPNGKLSTLLSASFPNERINDMVLEDETKNVLIRILEEQKHRQLFASHGLDPRRKFMLVGPPGCGKTMTAKMLAGELSIPLFVVRLEGLLSRYLGETSIHLSSIFDSMKENIGIYLFDEFDSIGTFRGDARDIGEVRRILSTFLQLIENDDSDSIIIAATNYGHVLDDALFRRFDDVVEFSEPDKSLADVYLRKRLSKLFKNKDVVFWDKIAEKSAGLSFADLERICKDSIKSMLINKSDYITENYLLSAINERVLISKRIKTRSKM